MSEYGLKIKNYQAASIYECNNGFRNKYDSTDAMLTNSLFLDFLMENGIEVWKGESTRDVVCLEFGYGTKSYLETVNKISSLKNEDNAKNLDKLLENVERNKDMCAKYTKQELRTKFYVEGFDLKYPVYDKSGNKKSEEVIHYKMLYRTPGKAKKGTCMFINEKLYDVAHNFLYMGIELPKEKSPIIQMGAYSSLITSIVNRNLKQEILEMNYMDLIEIKFS